MELDRDMNDMSWEGPMTVAGADCMDNIKLGLEPDIGTQTVSQPAQVIGDKLYYLRLLEPGTIRDTVPKEVNPLCLFGRSLSDIQFALSVMETWYGPGWTIESIKNRDAFNKYRQQIMEEEVEKLGTIEVMVRNRQVSEYIKNLENRLKTLEDKVFLTGQGIGAC